MSPFNIFVWAARQWRQHWARIISADIAANKVEPELPASVFVRLAAPDSSEAAQSKARARADRQRSASISINKG
jgi:hypothetical protein